MDAGRPTPWTERVEFLVTQQHVDPADFPPLPTAAASNAMEVGDVVHLDLPASTGYVSVVRGLVVGMGARSALTVDQLEDLRQAVTEGIALLLPICNAEASMGHPRMSCDIQITESGLDIGFEIPAAPDAGVDTESFTFMLLTTLVSDVLESRRPGFYALHLRAAPEEYLP